MHFYRDLAKYVTCCMFVLILLCFRAHYLPTSCIYFIYLATLWSRYKGR